MDSWKTLAIALLTSVSTQAVSGDDVNPIAAAIFITISSPTILIGLTTSLTTDPPKIFKSAKSDALAFIGSSGQRRMSKVLNFLGEAPINRHNTGPSISQGFKRTRF